MSADHRVSELFTKCWSIVRNEGWWGSFLEMRSSQRCLRALYCQFGHCSEIGEGNTSRVTGRGENNNLY